MIKHDNNNFPKFDLIYCLMCIKLSSFGIPTKACDKGKTFGARETSALCVNVAINTLLSPLSESSYRCKCDNITLFLNMLFEEILSRCVIPKSPRRNYGRDISPINGIHLRTVFKEPRGLGGMHVRSRNRYLKIKLFVQLLLFYYYIILRNLQDHVSVAGQLYKTKQNVTLNKKRYNTKKYLDEWKATKTGPMTVPVAFEADAYY
uniref:Uncharacterized protein n=1 Tax=Strigamia maritima TaxID=126957 RepID=T1J044_STRMM